MDRCVCSAAVIKGKEEKKKKKRRRTRKGKERKVYAVKRHDGSLFTQKQPERGKKVNELMDRIAYAISR